jgi:glucose-1-phosphate cytidylyltransferase
MKAVILAGGLGTRISEESGVRPKPMIEIGGKPILWHIMKMYAVHGINEFVVALGYKGYIIKEYFANYALHTTDVTFDMRPGGGVVVHERSTEPWSVTLVDTGSATMTGGRLKRLTRYLPADEPFCCTYGDGVSDVDITQTIADYRDSGGRALMTVVQPPGRFGAVSIDAHDRVSAFVEKPQGDGAWINGGFFVLAPSVLDMIEGDDTVFEQAPLEQLAAAGTLVSYRHHGFWQPLDTLRDKNTLEALWAGGSAPWKRWSP